MKKTHLILLIITGLTMIFSAYSLAAFNQVYKINFEWYSQYNNKFLSQQRNDLDDDWRLSGYPKQMKFDIIADKDGLTSLKKDFGNNIGTEISKADLNKYILIHGTLGAVDSMEYRIKIIDIAQRETVVEIKLNVNSPPEKEEKKDLLPNKYFPQDIVRIEKTTFPTKGKLRFIFKNQNGKQLYECYSYIK